MYRIALSALLLAVAASGSAQAAGLELNTRLAGAAGNVPVLRNLVTSRGLALPVVGRLPSVNFTLGPRFVLLGGVNIADLANGVDVGDSDSQYASQLVRQVRTTSMALDLRR